MKKYNKPIRYILFIGILLALFMIFIQGRFEIIKEKPLMGAIVELPKVQLTAKDWFSGEYQKQEEKYLNENFGFRKTAVRLNNQIAYSLFKKAKANSVVVGKENYLLEESYIDAYYGADYIGNDSLAWRMHQLKTISDTLKKLNKNLLLVFAAGKGSYYPEYIPDKYNRKKSLTNHDAYLTNAKKYDIDYIDFHTYFIENKNKSQYSLYPKYGIHWSYYGMCLAADSIIRYIEHKRDIDMRNLYWDKINMDYPKGADYDIGDGMNLLCRLPSEKMAYPELQIEAEEGKSKPSVLVVGDSFYWGIEGMPFTDAFSDEAFWYYNKEVHKKKGGMTGYVKDLNLADEINKYDIIIIMCTEAKLPTLGWGFIQNTYELYH